jgi:7,8-dihydropterin-6-yl-methyl-4-(beta-D-ribofuranosyl)aminobenzene 5'-phosphate synthase
MRNIDSVYPGGNAMIKTAATFTVGDCRGADDEILRLALAFLLLASLSLAAPVFGQATPFSPAAAAPAARLTILGDNVAARDGVKAVWGFACLVEARGHTVLFDVGADPAALKDNLAALKVDPAKIEVVVISHWHPDHVDGAPGLGKLTGVRVLTPRRIDTFAKLVSAGFKEDAARNLADWLAKETAKLTSAGLEVVAVSQATPLFDGIAVSEPLPFGEMPTDKPGTESTYVFWEQCLTVDTPDGLVVIVGCSHPGILPMLEEVKRRTGRPLYLVIGGFHLLDRPEAEVRQIAKAMQTLGVAYVSPTHCTGKAAVRVFRDVFRDRYVAAGVGAVIDLPLAATSADSIRGRPEQAAQAPANGERQAVGSNERLRELMTERYEIIRSIAESTETLLAAGRASLSEWRDAKVAVYVAQADICADSGERIKIYQEMVDFLRTCEQKVQQSAASGRADEAEVRRARLATTDAQIALEKLRLGQTR